MNLHCKIMSKSNISKLNISKLNISKLNISKLDIHKIFYSIFWRAAAQGVEGARVDLFSKTQSQFFPLNFNSQIPVHFLAMFITWILCKTYDLVFKPICKCVLECQYWETKPQYFFVKPYIFWVLWDSDYIFSIFFKRSDWTTSVMYNKSLLRKTYILKISQQ